MSGRLHEGIRRRKEGEALRVYAQLLVEHERVRRLRGGASPSAAAACKPSPRAWRPLHDVAFFQAAGERSVPLREFCSRFPRGDAAPGRVPCGPYLAALRVALELAGDGVVQHGGEAPWGKGQPRAPESAEAFDAICRNLRDRDADADEFGSLAAILDSVAPRPAAPAGPRVVLDAAEYTLVIGETAMSVPEGQERDFLRALVTASKLGRVTPVEEHGRVWKGAVDRLRKRIRRATGRPLLGAVVLTARGRTGGYRLNPNVEIRAASEVGVSFLPEEALDALAHPVRGRSRSGRRDEDD
ncbi:MAG: hypothetical protein FJ290_22150 [Planctomycetes bacterium]|nr:hypothetical protein [Planctomycetota bacterium]